MRRSRRSLVVSLLVAVGVLVAGVATAAPAHAYGSLTVNFAEFRTSTCTTIRGNLLASVASDVRCWVNGEARELYWRDAGGTGVHVELRDTSGLVGFVAFHPYDEILTVADTRNDGDAIYVELLVENPDNPIVWDLVGVFHAPGTSSEFDFLERDLSFPEGRGVGINIFDDAGRTDLIRGAFLGFA